MGTFGRRIGSIILVPIYTRYLTPADYGILNLVGVFTSLLVTILGLGIPDSIFRYYIAEDTDRGRRRVLSACLGLLLLVLIPIFLILAFARPIAAALLDDPALWGLLVLSLASLYGDLLTKVPLAPIRST